MTLIAFAIMAAASIVVGVTDCTESATHESATTSVHHTGLITTLELECRKVRCC